MADRTENDSNSVYAPPRTVEDIDDCFFYHTMDLPEHGVVEGLFDLRGHEHKYLGKVDFSGKRVLEIGTASGCLCYYMESQGAEVVGYDLSEDARWDIVPFSTLDVDRFDENTRSGVRKLNNAWWFNHGLLNSKAKVVYGSVYDVPMEIGPVDISTFCAVLTHFENPFRALVNALRLTREKVIVTEVWGRIGRHSLIPYLLTPFKRPSLMFLPHARMQKLWGSQDELFGEKGEHLDKCMSWWMLSPKLIKAMLGVLGFEKSTVTYHFPKFYGKRLLAITVVAERTRPMKNI